MATIANILIALIALLHLYILWFEMFAWETKGPKIFADLPREIFPKTKAMAANQGLYNGFLAAGLIWSLVISDPEWSCKIALFFLGCVAVAGVYGGMTVSKRIPFVQTVPAAFGIVALLLS